MKEFWLAEMIKFNGTFLFLSYLVKMTLFRISLNS